MGKKAAFLLVILTAVLIMFLFPSSLFAAPSQWAVGSGGNGHYYEVFIVTTQGGLTWTDSDALANSKTFNDGSQIYTGHLVSITDADEAAFVNSIIQDKEIRYWIGPYQTPDSSEADEGWNWVNCDPWGYTAWLYIDENDYEPNDGGDVDYLGNFLEDNDENYAFLFNGTWTDLSNSLFFVDGYIVEYDEIIPDQSNSSDLENTSGDTEKTWIRNHEMTCFQVWINEDNNFEFVFWWVYANNNWVQIYDMAGNLVWETDFPKNEPHFEVDLPDGMYTVKTFHEYGHILQEFVIGKP